MKTETIERILDIGTNLMLKHGYHSVGLNKILSEANIPKGSFYYYFKSKEDFGLQVIEHYSKKSLFLLNSYLNDESKNPKERIISFFEDRQNDFESNEFKEGCLLGNCSAELSDFSESFSTSVANEFSNWQETFENCIREGQEKGYIKTDESAKILSDLVLTTWEGTLLRMKSSKSVDSIKTFIHFLDKYIL
ncbi:TetR family transcriptional regulator [Muricauda sp. JGD-17]|uniref:TetR family transcriptional regulator n=1 Tax=Flagellimonas ochracea TaxID=2696472 RepID=A0A964TEI6_9FLAO|nr:TetR/AcrR family transcriptional regulator [Allomuricauda ochracea]NAY93480.1 TetR family transcriptional regulator [Allomuricauda ochracea]